MHSTILRKLACVLVILISASAYSAPREATRIKVLSNERWLTTGAPEVQQDCNWRDFSAYCTSSAPETYVENAMRVQGSNGRSMQIACTVWNQWSHCTDLPVGEIFPARQKKHALVIRYMDRKGKERDQEYRIVTENHP